MSRFELLSILIAVVGVGAVLAGLIVNGQSTIRTEARADRAEAQAAREAMRAEARAEAQAAREAMRAEARAGRAEARAAREAMRAEARADRAQFQAEIKRLLERQGKVEGLVEGLSLVTPSR